MKKILALAFAIVSLNSIAQTKNFVDQNYIEVTGKAELEIIPNEIYMSIVISERDFKEKENVEVLEKKMIEKLQSLGIDVSKNLVVKDMASNFKKYWIKTSDITKTKEYQLKVESAKIAGSVFKGLEEIGISNISIERVDHSEIEKFKQEVKVKAIKNAKEKAQALTAAIDQTCGKAIYIQEQNYNVYSPMRMQAESVSMVSKLAGSFDREAFPDIEFEKIKLEYSIFVRFELH